MASSRDKILAKLRAAQQPFPHVPPRPRQYLPVTPLADERRETLLQRFCTELERLNGVAIPVADAPAACTEIVRILQSIPADRVLAWDFEHIPVEGLMQALETVNIRPQQLDIHQTDRTAILNDGAQIAAGLTGADAALATTGSLVFCTAPGRDRIPTVLPRTHIAIIQQAQIFARMESWVAHQRANKYAAIHESGNLCFITGPSRTADIEKNLVLGMHGPEELYVVIVHD